MLQGRECVGDYFGIRRKKVLYTFKSPKDVFTIDGESVVEFGTLHGSVCLMFISLKLK